MKLKIFHGPINIAGIGRRLADWQRGKGAISDFITWNDQILGSASHFNLNLKKYSKITQAGQILALFSLSILRYKIFHFYFGNSLLPYNLDLPLLKIFRKKVLMTYCGSDCRLVAVEEKRSPYNKLLRVGLNHPKYDRRKILMMHWQNIWVDLFFAPRELYSNANKVIPAYKISKLFIHNALDMKKYIPVKYSTKEIPLLVHAPSEKGIKGTKFVERAIYALKNEGYKFEFQLVHNVPFHEAQEIFKNKADIIIDQFLVGSIGQLAVEGMYYGKPVVSYLIESVKEEHFPGCPVMNATIDNLKEKLAGLIENPNERIRLGKEGRAWVEKYFDSEKINQQLWNLYLNI